MSQPIAGRNGEAREWYVVDERQVRIGAGVVATVLMIASGFWAWRSEQLWTDRTADGICAACSNAAFQGLQAVLAVIGIVLGLVLVAYLIRVAATGRVWPYRRMLTIMFLSVASAWSLLVVAVVLGPF